MDHLPGNIIDDDRAPRCRMHVPSRRIAGIHAIRCRELLTIPDRLEDLLRRPPALGHRFSPLLGRMVVAKLPARLATGVMHEDSRASDHQVFQPARSVMAALSA